MRFDGLYDGCFSIIGYSFGLFGVGLLLAFFFGIGWMPSLFIFGIIGFLWLLNRLFSGNNTVNNSIGCISSIFSGLFSLTIVLLMGWAILSTLMRSCDGQFDSHYEPPSPIISDKEKVSEERIVTKTEVQNQDRDSCETCI